MTARVWTRKELDRVHQLPEGWAWELWGGSKQVAITADRSQWATVRDGHLQSTDLCPDADVSLAVILASKGLDSLGAMAAELERRAVAADRDAKKVAQYTATDGEVDAAGYEGEAQGLRYAAAMLRRGTVAP